MGKAEIFFSGITLGMAMMYLIYFVVVKEEVDG